MKSFNQFLLSDSFWSTTDFPVHFFIYNTRFVFNHGKNFPEERYSLYHSSCVSSILSASAISDRCTGFMVPAITCILAGCLKIQAIAIAAFVTPYFSASSRYPDTLQRRTGQNLTLSFRKQVLDHCPHKHKSYHNG